MLKRFSIIMIVILSISFIGCERTKNILIDTVAETETEVTETPVETETDVETETTDDDDVPSIDFNPDIQEPPADVFTPLESDNARYLDKLHNLPVFETATAAIESDHVTDGFETFEDILERFCVGELTTNDITRANGSEYYNSRFGLYFTTRDERTTFINALPENPALQYYNNIVDVVDGVPHFQVGIVIRYPEKACNLDDE